MTAVQVQSYFDRVAAGYNAASQGLLWRRVRERERRAMLRLLGSVAGRDVLDLGCGAGFYTRMLLAEGARHVWAVDLSMRMLAQLPSRGVTPVHGDAATVQPGRSFDVIVSAGMLEFVPDAAAVLRNAARVANPGARLVLLYPTSSLLGLAYQRFHKRHGLSIRLFDRPSLGRMADEAGWSLRQVAPAGPFSACARLERGN